jgi:hypothetical protein
MLTCRTTQKSIVNGLNLWYGKNAIKHHLVAVNKIFYLFFKNPNAGLVQKNVAEMFIIVTS